MDEATAKKLAAAECRKKIIQDLSGRRDCLRMDFDDEVVNEINATIDGLVLSALLAASRPAPGYLRASEGPDMRLLGTLPVTADGCVVGIGAELWCNAEEHGVFQWGSPPWVETSDAGWVFIDRDGADVAPQFMYSTRTAAESAKGGHHAE